MKQYLKYWCSPGYPGDPSNDPPDLGYQKGLSGVIQRSLKKHLVADLRIDAGFFINFIDYHFGSI